MTDATFSNVCQCRPDELPDLIRRVRSGVIRLSPLDAAGQPLGTGTGFLVRSGFLTNDHVLDTDYTTLSASFDEDAIVARWPRAMVEASKLLSSPHPGRKLEGLRGDFNYIQLDHPSFHGRHRFKLCVGDSLAVGDRVLYLGFPLGYSNLTAHVGYISSWSDSTEHRTKILQIDGSINLGNSGGPLLDIKTGLVAGIIVSAETGFSLNDYNALVGELAESIEMLEATPGALDLRIQNHRVRTHPLVMRLLVLFKNAFMMIRRSANVGIGYAVPISSLAKKIHSLTEDENADDL